MTASGIPLTRGEWEFLSLGRVPYPGDDKPYGTGIVADARRVRDSKATPAEFVASLGRQRTVTELREIGAARRDVAAVKAAKAAKTEANVMLARAFVKRTKRQALRRQVHPELTT